MIESFYELLLSGRETLTLICDDKKRSGTEFIADVDRLAGYLSGTGVKFSGQKVFIDIKDRVTFIKTFFAVSKLGGSCVLIPVEIAPEVFYKPGMIYLSDNKDIGTNIVIDPADNDSIKCGKLDIADDRADCELYLFTSGSTGQSKLINKTFINMFTEVKELKRRFNIDSGMTFYFTPPLYHIYGLLCGLLLPVYAGSTLDCNYHFSPESIADYVESAKIDCFISIPSYYRLIDSIGRSTDFGKIGKLFSSSAPLPVELSVKFASCGAYINEIYGSTETGGMAHRVAAKSFDWELFSYVKVLNKDISEPVELLIDSEAISVYYNKGEGYNTGDVVEFSSAGKFNLLGRNTRFVKISGKRLDLGFVTTKFIEYLKSKGLKDVAEEKIYSGCMNEKIFIITEYSLPEELHDVFNELKHHLPGYAIPRFILHSNIPRNEMGKVNKVKIDTLIQGKL